MSTIDKASLIQIPSGYKNGKLYSVKPNPSYGSEQISNGDFSNGSTGWTVSNGTVTDKYNASMTAYQNGIKISTFSLSGTYKLIFDLTITSGNCKFDGGGSNSQTYTTSGRKELTITNPTKFEFNAFNLGWVGTLDNVSVKEVLVADGDFTFARSSSATRVNSEGLIETAGVVSTTELVTNGDFATDSDWTKGAGWTISGGKATCDGSANFSDLTQNNTDIVIGKNYKITYTVSNYVSGSFKFIMNNNTASGLERNANGTYTDYISALSQAYSFRTQGSGFNGSIDNVSVKEVFENDVPRLDYSGGASCASLLLEPQTQNLVTYSEDFSQWSTLSANAATYVSDLVNPDGSVGGYKISGSGVYLGLSLLTTTQRSIYARSVSGSGNVQLFTHNSNTNNVFTITEDWQRFDVNSITSASAVGNYYIDLRGVLSTLSELYVWGAQATNDQSYVTSYIPSNSGSTTTRTADVCNNAGTSATFNDSEGVLFAEIAALYDDGTYRQISLTESSGGGDVLTLDYSSTSNQIRSFIRVNGAAQSLTHTLTDETQYNKIAIKYKDTHEIWVNGSKVASSSLTLLPIDINLLTFDNGAGGGDFYGKTKQLMTFNEALSDEELSDLTGQVNLSFNNLATFYNYTIL